MTVMGHIKNRIHSYIYDREKIEGGLNRILRRVTLENNVSNETPIFSNMEEYHII